jgi:hypothetical protein
MPGGDHFVGYVALPGAPVGREEDCADHGEGGAKLSACYEVTAARAERSSGRTVFKVAGKI